jgi:hypothetical protein
MGTFPCRRAEAREQNAEGRSRLLIFFGQAGCQPCGIRKPPSRREERLLGSVKCPANIRPGLSPNRSRWRPFRTLTTLTVKFAAFASRTISSIVLPITRRKLITAFAMLRNKRDKNPPKKHGNCEGRDRFSLRHDCRDSSQEPPLVAGCVTKRFTTFWSGAFLDCALDCGHPDRQSTGSQPGDLGERPGKMPGRRRAGSPQS